MASRRISTAAFAFLLTFVAGCLGQLSGTRSSPYVGTVCIFVQSSSHTLTAYLSLIYHHQNAAGRNIRLKALTGGNTLTLLQKAFDPAVGGDCDIFTGPGFSTLSVQLNPALPRLQIEHAAASDDLTDKNTFPFFMRVNPSAVDQGYGVADFIKASGYRRFALLSSSDAFSSSVATSVVKRAKEINLTVDESFLLSSTDTSQIEPTMREAAASNTRVMAVIFTFGMATANEVMRSINVTGFNKRHVMVGSASLCGNPVSDARRRILGGSICVTGTYSVAGLASLEGRGRDVASADAVYARAVLTAGGNTLNHDVTLSSSYTAYSVDAVGLAMLTIEQARARNVSVDDLGTMYRIATNLTYTGGLTGRTAVDPVTGSRRDSEQLMLNFAPDPLAISLDTAAVAFVPVGEHNTVTGYSPYADPRPVWYDGRSAYPSSDLIQPPAPPPSPVWPTAVGVTIGLVALCVLVAVVVQLYLKHAATSAAPKQSTEPFAVVMVSLRGLSDLQADDAHAAAQVMDGVLQAIEQHAAECNVYVAKRVGDAFLLAATDADRALRFASRLRQRFDSDLKANLLSKYVRQAQDRRSARASASSRRSGSTMRGSRSSSIASSTLNQSRTTGAGGSASAAAVLIEWSIGAHYGLGHVQHDANRNTYDYSGAVVEGAATCVDQARTGEVVVSDEIRDAVAALPDGARLVTHGTHDFRGGKQHELLLLVPQGVSVDTFARAHRSGEAGAGAHVLAALDHAQGRWAQKRVAVVVLRVRAAVETLARPAGISGLLDVNDVQRAWEPIDFAVYELAAAYKGVVHSNNAGVYTVSFNAAVSCLEPFRKACSFASDAHVELTAMVNSVLSRRTHMGGQCGRRPLALCSAGVSVGTAFCGEARGCLGDFAVPAHQVLFGSAALSAAALEGVAATFPGVLFAASAATLHELSAFAAPTFVDIVPLPTPGGTLAPTGVVAALAMTTANDTDDEWMYALKTGMRKDSPIALVNVAFGALLAGKRDTALAALEQAHLARASAPLPAEDVGNVGPDAGEMGRGADWSTDLIDALVVRAVLQKAAALAAQTDSANSTAGVSRVPHSDYGAYFESCFGGVAAATAH